MNFEQLKYFLVTEKHKNFTLASEELNISQSALSKHIQSLEYEIGAPLFYRNSRSVTLTPAGILFLTHANFLTDYYLKMQKQMEAFSLAEIKRITLACVPIMRIFKITEMIAAFKEVKNDISIDIIEENTAGTIRLLKSYKADVAFSSIYNLRETGFRYFCELDDELIMIVHKDHQFADRDRIPLSAAANENYLFLGADTAVHQMGIDQCKSAGFTPKTMNTLQSNMNIETIVDLVSKGFGVSLLMRKTAEHYANPDVKILQLDEKPIMSMALITRDEPISRVCREFIKFACDYYSHDHFLSN